MKKRYWRISGYKEFDTIFEVRIPVGSITADQLKELLKCLAATAGRLSYYEIIGAYVKRKTRLAHRILEVQGNGRCYFCGIDPSFVADIVDEEGNPIKPPPLPTVDVTRFM